MQHWIAITSDMLLQSLQSRELTALIKPESAAAIGEEIDDVVATIREAVANNRGNTLPADDTLIPRTLRSVAMDILRVRLSLRYGVAINESRQAAHDAALTRLAEIAKGTYLIIAPTGEIPSMPAHAPHVTAPDSTFGSSARFGWWPRPQ